MTWPSPDLRGRAGPAALLAGVVRVGSRWREDIVCGLFTLAVSVLLGAPVGLLWSAAAPHAHVLVDGVNDPSVIDAATEVFIAGDGWFFGLTFLVGVGCGVLTWLAARRSAPAVVVALVVGGLLGSYVASKVGIQPGQDALQAAISSRIKGTYVANVALQAKVAVVLWPLGALAAFAGLLVSRIDEIG